MPAPNRSSRHGPSRRRADLRLRRAGPKDLPTLVRHRRRMWEELRSYAPRELDRHDADYVRWVRRETTSRRFLAYVVETRTGEIAGSGALWLMPSQPRPGPLGRGNVPYILSMYTEPQYRGCGVASRLVREMVRWARSRRYGRVLLHASRFGRPVYERLGFEASSEMRLELIAQPPSPRRVGRAGRRSPGLRAPSARLSAPWLRRRR